jgi:hypothetical protein
VIYIGIDPGRRTGWAILNDIGERANSGHWHFKGSDWAAQFSAHVAGLLEISSTLTRDDLTVGFEHVTFHKGKAWAEIYYGQKALLMAMVPDAVLVTPAQAKETGGSRVKIGLMHNALEHWSLGEDYPIDDNEADALWIAETVRRREQA